MTNEQIQEYFGTDVVYIFNGTSDDLSEIMVTSYNYIVDGSTQILYFVTTDGTVPQDSRISRM